jgi:hypothetical protein
MMSLTSLQCASNWKAEDLQKNQQWVFRLNESQQKIMVDVIKRAFDPQKELLDYSRDDLSLDSAWETFVQALNEVKRGRGIALVKGLPRAQLTDKEFEVLTWALGLHAGVPRPQGKTTQYISAVRNAGVDYRTGTGRGYSSNAELDFHTDSSDIIFLSCFNKALSGGKTLVTSSMAAHHRMLERYPEQAQWLYEPIAFSRQGEEAPDEGPFVLQPVFSEAGGKWFGRWNWNRVRTAQKIQGAPLLAPEHYAALEQFDQVVRSTELAYEMWLEPGDVQIINSHVTLHSRTEFVDAEDPAMKRLLYRLWIAPPDADQLPECWRDLYRCCEPGRVRGGIRGHSYAPKHAAFEMKHASALGMQS